MTNRLECAGLDFLGLATRANRARGRARAELLRDADGTLDQWRLLVRLATDLDYFSNRQYEYAADKLAEIGRLLGAWQKNAAAGPG